MAPGVSMLGIHLMTLPLAVRSITHDHTCIHLRTVMFGPLSVTDVMLSVALLCLSGQPSQASHSLTAICTYICQM